MYPLIEITTVPIEIQMKVTDAHLEYARGTAQMEISREQGGLNIRSHPNLSGQVIAKAYDGTRLTVINQWQDWYLVQFDGVIGYASSEFITLLS